MRIDLDVVFECWRSYPDLFSPREPASEDAIAAAEHALGQPLPDGFKEFYRRANGFSDSSGDLDVYPLEGHDGLSLVSASARYREWKWPVPDEVVLFASNGSGEPYGLWTGPCDAERYPEPIVQIGEIFEPGSMGVASESLVRLLFHDALWTLLLEGMRAEVVGSLGLQSADLPDDNLVEAMITRNLDQEMEARRTEQFQRLEDILHPQITSAWSDPYAAKLDAKALERLLT